MYIVQTLRIFHPQIILRMIINNGLQFLYESCRPVTASGKSLTAILLELITPRSFPLCNSRYFSIHLEVEIPVPQGRCSHLQELQLPLALTEGLLKDDIFEQSNFANDISHSSKLHSIIIHRPSTSRDFQTRSLPSTPVLAHHGAHQRSRPTARADDACDDAYR